MVLTGRVLWAMVAGDTTHIAAGVAFFALFSLFPLLLGSLAILGLFLNSEEIQQRFVGFVTVNLPGSAEFVRSNLSQIVRFRSALGLGGVGIYSVVSYAVGRRIREIGIRMTLGAQPRNVIGIVLMRGMQPVLIGLAVGLASVFGLARLLRSLLFNVNPIDWQTYGAVSALLAAVALIACYVPARRAVSADPTDALRQE